MRRAELRAITYRRGTIPVRTLALTEKGRRALDLDRAGINLPASYHAWGASDSPVCENGHLRCKQTVALDGGCRACHMIGVVRKRRRAA